MSRPSVPSAVKSKSPRKFNSPKSRDIKYLSTLKELSERLSEISDDHERNDEEYQKILMDIIDAGEILTIFGDKEDCSNSKLTQETLRKFKTENLDFCSSLGKGVRDKIFHQDKDSVGHQGFMIKNVERGFFEYFLRDRDDFSKLANLTNNVLIDIVVGVIEGFFEDLNSTSLDKKELNSKINKVRDQLYFSKKTFNEIESIYKDISEGKENLLEAEDSSVKENIKKGLDEVKQSLRSKKVEIVQETDSDSLFRNLKEFLRDNERVKSIEVSPDSIRKRIDRLNTESNDQRSLRFSAIVFHSLSKDFLQESPEEKLGDPESKAHKRLKLSRNGSVHKPTDKIEEDEVQSTIASAVVMANFIEKVKSKKQLIK